MGRGEGQEAYTVERGGARGVVRTRDGVVTSTEGDPSLTAQMIEDIQRGEDPRAGHLPGAHLLARYFPPPGSAEAGDARVECKFARATISRKDAKKFRDALQKFFEVNRFTHKINTPLFGDYSLTFVFWGDTTKIQTSWPVLQETCERFTGDS